MVKMAKCAKIELILVNYQFFKITKNIKIMEEDIIKKEEEKDIEKPKNELEECNKKCDEYLNNWKRERADFLNYKKDEIERMAFLGQYAKEDIILKILPVLDSFYLAEKQLPDNLKNGEKGSPQAIEWTKGFLQIQNQIKEFLKKEGIEEIESVGQKFNPETMEAVEEVEGEESGIVIEELQKGYKMQDKVLRPAKVKISK